MDYSKKNNDSFNHGKTEKELMLDKIFQSRAYWQIPADPKLEQLSQEVTNAAGEFLLAKDKILNEGSHDLIYLVNARANYKNKLELLLKCALEIDAQLDQINLN